MLAAVLATPHADAQLLDLDMPEAPDTGDKSAAALLAESLTAQGEQLTTDKDGPGALQGEVRLLAAELLRTGRPSAQLAARTIVRALPELDALCAQEWADPVDRLLTLGDLRRARAQVPGDDDALDRALRAAFWRLCERGKAPAGIGWVEPARTTAPAISMAEATNRLRALGVDDETLGRVGELARLLDEADDRRAFAPSAAHVRATVASAVRAISDPPRWVSEENLEAGAAGIAASISAMLDPDEREAARDVLDRYARTDALIRRADAMETTNDVKAFRERLAASLGAPLSAGAIEALTRALDLLDALSAHAGAGARDEKSLVRQLRPAWRWTQRIGSLGARDLAAAMTGIADTPEPLTDPGVLSDLTAAREPVELAAALIELSDLLDQDESAAADRPEAEGVNKEIADRILEVSGRLSHPERGPAGRLLIKLCAQDLARAREMESVGVERLKGLAQGARAQVIAAWASEEDASDGGPEAARLALDRVERALAWADAGETMRQLERGGALVQAWGGVELSVEGAKALRSDVDERVDHLLGHAEQGETAEMDVMLTFLDTNYPAVRALGQIERRLRELTGDEGADSSWSVLVEIAFGPPDPGDAWLIDQRGRLAELCAQAEELAAATIRDDRPAAGDLRDVVNRTGEALVRAVEGR